MQGANQRSDCGPEVRAFSLKVNEVDLCSTGNPSLCRSFILHLIGREELSICPQFGMTLALFSFKSGHDRNPHPFPLGSASVGMDATSGHLALRVLRDPLARTSFLPIPARSCRRPLDDLRTGDECHGDGCECRSNARGRNASLNPPCEPNVARGHGAHTVVSAG